MRYKHLLPLIATAVLAANLVQVPAASAASVKKCKAPSGARAPIRDLKAGYATSCGTAKKVAKLWDRKCEPYGTLCSVDAGGRRWRCRSLVHDVPKYRTTAFVKCAGKETVRGRPAVNFKQPGAAHPCSAPDTRAAIERLYGFYDARCGRALAVARGWDSASDCAQADRSTCTFEAGGERWECTRYGVVGHEIDFPVICTGSRTGGGRPAVQFRFRAPPAWWPGAGS